MCVKISKNKKLSTLMECLGFFFFEILTFILVEGFSRSFFSNPLVNNLEWDGLSNYFRHKISHVCLFVSATHGS
jgi:hypothetical protein